MTDQKAPRPPQSAQEVLAKVTETVRRTGRLKADAEVLHSQVDASHRKAERLHQQAIFARKGAQNRPTSGRTMAAAPQPKANGGNGQSPSESNSIIVIGASAGGVEAVRALVSALPKNLPAPVFVVIHTSAEGPGLLASVLNGVTPLMVVTAEEGMKIEPGHVYVARPDRHMLIDDHRVRLSRGPTENRHRPAIDPLFRSAARNYDGNTIGVILTGYLDDGTAGLIAIKRAGGRAVVQAPDDALVSDMPRNALEHVTADHVVSLRDMPSLLVAMTNGHAGGKPTMPQRGKRKEPTEKPSRFTCPECSGTLFEVDDHGLLHFRCRVGHAFSAESMAEDHDEALERALWAALRTLEESIELNRRLAERAKGARHKLIARRFEDRARTATANAELLRAMLSNSKPDPARISTEGAESGDGGNARSAA